MSATKRLNTCFVLVAIALCLPVAGSYVCQNEVKRADRAIAAPFTIPEQLGRWRVVPSPDDISGAESLTRWYENPEHERIGVVINRGTVYRGLHELYYCLVARGWKVVSDRSFVVETGGAPLKTRILRYRVPERDGDSLSLLWYQKQNQSFERISKLVSCRLRLDTLLHRQSPELREVRILVKRSGDENKDMKALTSFACTANGFAP